MKKKIMYLLKKMCLLLFIICCSFYRITAQTEIVVTYYDETEDMFSIEETGKLCFNGSYLVVDESGLNTQNIEIALIRKITMLQNQVSVTETDLTSEADMYVYPNPVGDYMKIFNGGLEKINVEIYSLNGQLLMQKNYVPDEQINVSHLKTGLYIIKIDEKIFKINKL